ncbi:duf167 domain containing protein [Dermatophagoides farinae]|uniref:Duf167 domain containing protein n=1 Tax=Dermatophagoides farinae TaxID=6954 RepID=A0A9D4NT67_DERFA|nr:duf167 domain containing protein [Dermatophagoides farinae]
MWFMLTVAKPGAKKSQIISIDDDAIGVQIAAPPREGAANEELIDYMSHVLGVKTKCIQLDVGTKSRNKILLINFGTTTKTTTTTTTTATANNNDS